MENVAHCVCVSSRWWHILFYNIKKKNHIYYHRHQKVFIGKLPSSCFPKSLIFVWKLGFYDWPQTLPIVFLEMTGSLCSFSRNIFARHPGLNNYHFPVVLSCKNNVLWKKIANSVCNGKNHTSAFSLDNRVLSCIRHTWGFYALCVLFMSLRRTLRSHAKKK